MSVNRISEPNAPSPATQGPSQDAPAGDELLSVLEDPYDYYGSLREQCPVLKSPVGYLVTRHEDVMAVFRDTGTFSSKVRGDSGTKWGNVPTPAMREVLAQGFPEVDVTVTCDPPEHRHFRALAAQAFRPRRIRQIESTLVDLADTLIDDFADDGEVEFVSQFAIPFPLTVIGDFLGADRSDLDRLLRWSDDTVAPLSGTLDDDEQLRCAKSRVEAQHYVMRLIRERATTPADDLLSDLVHAEGDKRLHENEILSIALGLLVAGNESTRSMLANGMAVLVRRPEIAETLRANPERVPDFVEELLRYDSSVQIQYRRATVDVELAGTRIPQGERVAIALGSANRDQNVHTDAAGFDLDRANKTHLTFGYGEHLCIGAPLARAQLKVAFTQLVTRLRDWRVATSGTSPTRTRSATLRGFTVLPLSFRKAEAADIAEPAEKSPR